MSKSSKSCGYTGHMRIMNRVNETKKDYQSEQAKSCGLDNSRGENHQKHTVAYPEVSSEARIQAKCNCNRKK